MQEEQHRRIIKTGAGKIEAFLRHHPESEWHFAAGPDMHYAVLNELSTAACSRIGTAITKNLAVVQPAKLLPYFAHPLDSER